MYDIRSRPESGEGEVGCEEKVLHLRVMGMEQAPQGSGHSLELVELKEHLDTALRHRIWVLDVLYGARSWTCYSFP